MIIFLFLFLYFVSGDTLNASNPGIGGHPDFKGFSNGFTDETYGYLIPTTGCIIGVSNDPCPHSHVVKFSLETFDAIESLNISIDDILYHGFSSGFAHGNYGYLIPSFFRELDNSTVVVRSVGHLIRFPLDTFDSIEILDLGEYRGFMDGFHDNQYGYLVPNINGSVYHGNVVRFPLDTFDSYDVLDITEDNTHPDLVGFITGFTDDIYGYLIPRSADSKIVRFSLNTFDNIETLNIESALPDGSNLQTSFSSGFVDSNWGYLIDTDHYVARFPLHSFDTIYTLDYHDLAVNGDPDYCGFSGSFTDGYYGYLVPGYCQSSDEYRGMMLYFDLNSFNNFNNMNLTLEDEYLRGFISGFNSNGAIYLVPWAHEIEQIYPYNMLYHGIITKVENENFVFCIPEQTIFQSSYDNFNYIGDQSYIYYSYRELKMNAHISCQGDINSIEVLPWNILHEWTLEDIYFFNMTVATLNKNDIMNKLKGLSSSLILIPANSLLGNFYYIFSHRTTIYKYDSPSIVTLTDTINVTVYNYPIQACISQSNFKATPDDQFTLDSYCSIVNDIPVEYTWQAFELGDPENDVITSTLNIVQINDKELVVPDSLTEGVWTFTLNLNDNGFISTVSINIEVVNEPGIPLINLAFIHSDRYSINSYDSIRLFGYAINQNDELDNYVWTIDNIDTQLPFTDFESVNTLFFSIDCSKLDVNTNYRIGLTAEIKDTAFIGYAYLDVYINDQITVNELPSNDNDNIIVNPTSNGIAFQTKYSFYLSITPLPEEEILHLPYQYSWRYIDLSDPLFTEHVIVFDTHTNIVKDILLPPGRIQIICYLLDSTRSMLMYKSDIIIVGEPQELIIPPSNNLVDSTDTECYVYALINDIVPSNIVSEVISMGSPDYILHTGLLLSNYLNSHYTDKSTSTETNSCAYFDNTPVISLSCSIKHKLLNYIELAIFKNNDLFNEVIAIQSFSLFESVFQNIDNCHYEDINSMLELLDILLLDATQLSNTNSFIYNIYDTSARLLSTIYSQIQDLDSNFCSLNTLVSNIEHNVLKHSISSLVPIEVVSINGLNYGAVVSKDHVYDILNNRHYTLSDFGISVDLPFTPISDANTNGNESIQISLTYHPANILNCQILEGIDGNNQVDSGFLGIDILYYESGEHFPAVDLTNTPLVFSLPITTTRSCSSIDNAILINTSFHVIPECQITKLLSNKVIGQCTNLPANSLKFAIGLIRSDDICVEDWLIMSVSQSVIYFIAFTLLLIQFIRTITKGEHDKWWKNLLCTRQQVIFIILCTTLLRVIYILNKTKSPSLFGMMTGIQSHVIIVLICYFLYFLAIYRVCAYYVFNLSLKRLTHKSMDKLRLLRIRFFYTLIIIGVSTFFTIASMLLIEDNNDKETINKLGSAVIATMAFICGLVFIPTGKLLINSLNDSDCPPLHKELIKKRYRIACLVVLCLFIQSTMWTLIVSVIKVSPEVILFYFFDVILIGSFIFLFYYTRSTGKGKKTTLGNDNEKTHDHDTRDYRCSCYEEGRRGSA